MEKTNVMRVLTQKKIPYTERTYDADAGLTGAEIAALLGEDAGGVFKTLVTVSASKKYYVFMVPVAEELDLKKAAKAAGEKKIEMIPQKELLPLTGYVHGGCSPIGMKKAFPTFVDASAAGRDRIFFSGGKVGFQVEIAFSDLKKAVNYRLADVVKEREEA